MPTALRLPPSERDFQLYQRVVVDAASTRQAARECSLSQTRVRQVVQRVADWLRETLPDADEVSDAAQLRFARHVAADRLEYFYSEAMRGWRQWQQPKYASLALRVIAAQSKLPVMPGTLDALAADAIEGPLPEEEVAQEEPGPARRRRASQAEVHTQSAASEEKRQTFSAPANPPSGDCSGSPSLGPSAAAPSPMPPAPTQAGEPTCPQLPPAVRAARKAFFAPAQPPTDDDSPVTQLKITPEQLGLSVEEILSRTQRRQRRRAKAGA
jgi:hypothetical protein